MEPEKVSSCLVDIQGMRCQSCVRNIQNTIGQKLGVISIIVDLEKKEGLVKYAANIITPAEVAESIDDMGFPCVVKTETPIQGIFQLFIHVDVVHTNLAICNLDVTVPVEEETSKNSISPVATAGKPSPVKSEQKCFITISGMTCASCVAAIEKHTLKLEGNSLNKFQGKLKS